ncbi:MAG TPA: DEAD/DEAH box helicase [Candidatus Polarisedimenticolaceae bacterium]|nr:DEAD/DEAH box helicase [Candidatus Polarisedimenticolaceae bacterium]
MNSDDDVTPPRFEALGLSGPLLRALQEIGYEAPTSIQASAIPPLLAGNDLLGQAQTGTGKTAAFALPLLSRLDLSLASPQVLVLTPTRELAIQVAEAMQTYARHLSGFHVLPIYGGQSMETQIRHLARGVHAVAGTPGRILDHLRRGTLKLDRLSAAVLDEADEMLRMGFIDDVTTILEQAPSTRQIALFSATMPPSIRKVAEKYLREPVVVRIATRTTTVATVTQRYWEVTGVHKLTALTRILDAEDIDAMLIFVRTKNATVELSEKLEARGFPCAPLNGDMAQSLRERTVERLKQGALDIVVATDIAARGLHVERISHVVNYDVPQDPEAYVHRIGRTARAGKEGQAILFVSPRERFLLHAIERATGQKIAALRLPTPKDIADRRIAQFKAGISSILASEDLDLYARVIDEYREEQGIEWRDVAVALTYLAQRQRPFVPARPKEEEPQAVSAPVEKAKPAKPRAPRPGRLLYRLEVGREHGISPKLLVDIIVTETGVERRHIGDITIHRTDTTIELPAIPRDLLRHLKKVRVKGRPLRIALANA